MAMYTMQLRTIIEQATQYDEDLTYDERIEIGRKKLFDFDYPLFSENYRKQFETNIINEFYMREIGFETEGLFKRRLQHWLNVNMPYYNKLFESELIKYNPLINSEMRVRHTKENDKEQNDIRDIEQKSNTHGTGKTDSLQTGNVDSTTNSKSNTKQNTKETTKDDGTKNRDTKENEFNRSIESDTPQNRLRITTNNNGTGVIEYASKIDENTNVKDTKSNEKTSNTGTKNTDSNTDSSGETVGNVKDKVDFHSEDETNVDSKAEQEDKYKSDISELEKFVQHRVGKIGVQTYSKMIQEYRQALLRVEVQIHDELQQLFMLVY